MKTRVPILNLWIDPVTMEQALETVSDFIERGTRVHSIFAVNPEKNFSVPKDPSLYESFKNADLLIPDSIGVVLAARVLHGLRLERVPGVELMHAICALSARKGYTTFIYGARESVNEASVNALQGLYPGIRIVGRANGYLGEAEMEGLVEQINNSGAQILFLALGSPRQERWLNRYAVRLKNIRVCQGIGGTLDTIAGTVKRAPEAWCRNGLEWLYRLLAEPSRLKRQSVLPLFAAHVAVAKFRYAQASQGIRNLGLLRRATETAPGPNGSGPQRKR